MIFVYQETLNILAAASRDERAQFLKRFLNILPNEELNDAKSIVRRTRRRELKKAGVVPQPVTVPQPTPESLDAVTAVAEPVEDVGWWIRWTQNGNCMAMDVEKVSVPVDPSQCEVVKF